MNRYSKNAMPQLARMTSQSGEFLNFKCPYHANVMKMFESVSNTTGSQRDEVISMTEKMNSRASRVKLECAGFTPFGRQEKIYDSQPHEEQFKIKTRICRLGRDGAGMNRLGMPGHRRH